MGWPIEVRDIFVRASLPRDARKVVERTIRAVTRSNHLPGRDVVEQGLADLAAGVESVASLLVAIGAPRLRELGLPVSHSWTNPEHQLYQRLVEAYGPDEAHSRYNALIRQLVSFERAAECVA